MADWKLCQPSLWAYYEAVETSFSSNLEGKRRKQIFWMRICLLLGFGLSRHVYLHGFSVCGTSQQHHLEITQWKSSAALWAVSPGGLHALLAIERICIQPCRAMPRAKASHLPRPECGHLKHISSFASIENVLVFGNDTLPWTHKSQKCSWMAVGAAQSHWCTQKTD